MEMKFNKNKRLSIDIAVSAVWCLFVLIVTGCDWNLLDPAHIVILVLGFAG